VRPVLFFFFLWEAAGAYESLEEVWEKMSGSIVEQRHAARRVIPRLQGAAEFLESSKRKGTRTYGRERLKRMTGVFESGTTATEEVEAAAALHPEKA